MLSTDDIIFNNKRFSDILSEIYDNQIEKKNQITGLINELKPLIQEIGDATLIVPLLKEYLDMGIKNNEHLIKMATIVQRLIQGNGEEGGVGLSQTEKDQLLQDIGDIGDKYKKLNQDNEEPE
jgi:hypothetical protein